MKFHLVVFQRLVLKRAAFRRFRRSFLMPESRRFGSACSFFTPLNPTVRLRGNLDSSMLSRLDRLKCSSRTGLQLLENRRPRLHGRLNLRRLDRRNVDNFLPLFLVFFGVSFAG